MKKILLSAYACLPNAGSEEGNGWHYASLLSERGFAIHCLTRCQNRQAIEAVLRGDLFPNLTMHYVVLPGWVDGLFHKGLLGMYLHYLCWQWMAWRTARTLDRTLHFDLVHHVTYGSIQLGSFLYKLRKPFVFGPVGGGQRAPKAFRAYFGPYWTRERLRDAVSVLLQYLNPGFFRAVRQADVVVTTNRDTYRLARKLRPTGKLYRLFDTAVSGSFYPKRPIERTPTGGLNLLWVGRLMPRKAIELTLQAFSLVDPELPVRLTVVGGKGEMAEHMPTYLSKYDPHNRVDWVGHVSFEQVRTYYEQSDVFFFTSLRDSCPAQLLEAMAYGMPVLTLNLHGQAELVDDETGIRVAVRTPEQVVADLARAIEWLYAHPTERQAMGRAAERFARSLAWDSKITEVVEQLYTPLLEPNRALEGEAVRM
jgi:glycosyltransferase involved in cell wall biosynthesis